MTSAPTCPRLFEVEALRNGRLSGSERQRFERHLSQCPACSRESEALESLARALRTSQVARDDELHVRRERTRLLSAFDRALVSQAAPARRAALWQLLAGFAVLAAIAVYFTRAPAPPAARAPLASIEPRAGAVWSRSTQAGRERIVLTSGVLSIRVTHPARGPALLLLLPDGELEDIGTVFSVAVENGRTNRVSVVEGSVVLRLQGRSPIALAAGEIWQAEPEPAAPPSGAPPLAVPAPAAIPTPLASPTALTVPAPLESSQPPLRAPAVARSRAASEDFRAAVAALNAGDNPGAAARFERFLEQHPRDARTEDAAYLRVLALKRAGAGAGVNAAAREYLRRFPNGFRRREVDRLLE